jgi:L-lactate utilization protein LutC
MLLYHLGQQHPDQVGPHMARMRTECIATVAAEVFEVVEENETR